MQCSSLSNNINTKYNKTYNLLTLNLCIPHIIYLLKIKSYDEYISTPSLSLSTFSAS